ncbi:MAG: flippase [Candidatus Berkelbacteria bacterium]|nr:flippase [Candidatus Berkelbacteria bacterium]
MSYTRKVAYNTAVQIVGRVLGVGISVVTAAAIFRYLGIEGVGKYTTAFAFVSFFAVFADFGLGWTLLRELATSKDQNKAFQNIFTLRLLLAIAVHLISLIILIFFSYAFDVKMAIIVVTAAWFFQTMNSTIVAVFLNNYRLDISVAAEVLGKIVILGAILYLSKIGVSFVVLMSAFLMGNFVNFAINLIFANKFVKVGFAFDKEYLKKVIYIAVPIGVVIVFSFVYYKIDSIMLSLMKGMVDVGIYGTAYKILEVLQTFPVLFLGAAFPLITKYATQKDERVVPAFQKQFDFLALLALPIVVSIYLLASPIIALIAGSRGAEFISTATVTWFNTPLTSVTCLKILIFSVGLSFITSLYSYMIISLGKQRVMIWPTIGFAAFNLALNFLLIPKYSYFGAAFATLFTEIVVLLTSYYYANSFIRLPIDLKAFFRALLAAVLMGGAIYFLSQIGVNLLVNLAISFILYALLAILFKAVPMELIRAVIGREQ